MMPWEVDFTNTSTGTIDSYSWEVDDVEEGMNENFSFHFTEAKSYEVCLTITRGTCTNEKCVNIEIEYNCAEVCYQPVNGHFEDVVNPSAPGTIGSSINFDIDMCSWEQERITPYYCYYPEDTYIAVRVDNLETEAAQSTVELDLVDGEKYYVCFDYSVQRLDFGLNPFPNDGPQEIIVQLVEPGTSNKLVIATVYSPSVDYPSSEGSSEFLQTDFDCFNVEEVEWHKACELFTYDEDKPIMQLTGLKPTSNGVVPVIFFNKVRIIGCPGICDESPYFTATVDCETDFEIQDTVGGSTYTWDFGGLDTGTGITPSFTFPFGGTFDVCVTMTCPANEEYTYCDQIMIPDSCSSCSQQDTIFVSAFQCRPEDGEAENYITNFSFEVPTGNGPCGETFNIGSVYADIEVASYYVDESPSGHDDVYISLNINPIPGEDFSSNITAHIAVCDTNGNIICYDIIISPEDDCDCEDPVSITATCDTTINGVYSYSGNIDLSGTTGTFEDSYSEIAGLSLNTSTGDFTITSSYSGPIAGSLILTFKDSEGNIFCYLYEILTSEPCEEPPTTCLDEWYKDLECDERDCYESGLLSIPIPVGYVLCSGVTSATVDTGEVTIDTSYTIGDILYYDLTWCPPSGFSDPTIYINFIFCNLEGDMVCHGIEFELADCSKSRNSKLSIDEKKFTFYPNPTDNKLTITSQLLVEFDNKDIQFVLYDLFGNKILSKRMDRNRESIDLEHISSGIYFIKVYQDEIILQEEKIVVAK